MYNEIKDQLIHPWEKKMRAINVIVFFLVTIGGLVTAIYLASNMDENKDNLLKILSLFGVIFTF